MKYFYVALLSIFIMTCAVQNPNIDKGDSEVSASQEDSFTNQYYSPLIALDLQKHKILLQELKEGEISKTEYDSIMIQYGRKPDFSLFYEELEVLLPSDSLHREAMYAEWYIQSDSLLSIPIMQLGSIVAVDSTLPAFLALLGKAYARMNDYSNSIRNFEALIPMVDDEKVIMIRRHFPSLYRQAGNPQKALLSYMEFKIQYPQEIESIWEDYFELCMELAKYDLAQSILDQMQASTSDTTFLVKNIEKYLDLFWQSKNYEEGINFISEVKDYGSTTHGPGTALNFAIAGRNFKKAKEIALNLYKPFLNKDIFFSFMDFKIDTSFHYNESISPLEFVMYLNPDDPDFHFTYGYVTYANELMKSSEEREEEKINLAQALLSKSGIDPDFASFLGGLQSAIIADYKNAYKKYDEVSRDHQLYPYSLVNKAYLAESIDQKIELLKEASSYSEIKESVQEHIGDLLFQNEKYARAITWYKKLVDAKSAEPKIMIKYAHVLVKLRQYTKAREVIEDILVEIQITSATNFFYKYLSMDTDLSDAYEVQGDSYAAEGNYPNAVLAYAKAVEKDLSDIVLLGKLTSIYKSQNEQSLINQAESRAKEFIESRDEIDSESYYAIIWKIFRREYENPTPDHSKNIKLFEEAIEYLPGDPSFYIGIGNEFKQLGFTQKAIDNLTKAIQLDPNRTVAYELISEIYQEKGDYRNAIPYQQRVTEQNRHAGANSDYLSSLRALADLYVKSKRELEAIQIYENALPHIQNDSLKASLFYNMGNIYWELDSLDEAGEIYAKSFELVPYARSAYFAGAAYYFTGLPEYYSLAEKLFRAAVMLPDAPEELINKAEEYLDELHRRRDAIDWPDKLIKLSQSATGDVKVIANLMLLASDFDEINDMIIQGKNETEPEKEYLEYSKEWIITSYRVSPKLYKSQGKIGLFKSQLNQIKTNNAKINSILNYWAQAAESTNIAIDLRIEGYYVKKADYTGQWEQSQAQVQIGRESIYDGMVVLKELASKHKEFKGQGARVIQASLDYYGKN